MANAKENCWPCIVVAGSSDTDQEGLGAFQVRVNCKEIENMIFSFLELAPALMLLLLLLLLLWLLMLLLLSLLLQILLLLLPLLLMMMTKTVQFGTIFMYLLDPGVAPS